MRVLIVDDNEDAANILADAVRLLLQIDVDVLTDSSKVLKFIKRHENEYAALLLDLIMPAPDGVEIARYVRETLKSSIPMLAVTGRPLNKDEAAASALFNDVVLQKPFRLADVEIVLKRLLARH